MATKKQKKQEKQLFFMFDESERLKSFHNWPFTEDCCCTPELMAKAGFYHCPTENEPDLVMCFMCRKELDGWEPEDNPLEEHRSHSKECPFLKLNKPFSELTTEEVLGMIQQAEIMRMKMLIDSVMVNFNTKAGEALDRLKRLK